MTTPIQRAPARTTGSIILLGALSLADRAINDEVNEGYHGLFADYVNEANRLGGPTVKYPALGIFAVSLLTRDTRFQDAAYTSLEAVVYANALNYAVKFAAGRERPEDSKSQYRFHPFSGNSSFPSGHACTAFALLTPWALYYRHPVTYGLLVAGAGGTALSRVARGKHWASDVTAGGTLGFLTALWLTERHQYAARQTAEQTGMKASLTPVTGPEGSGLRFTMQW